MDKELMRSKEIYNEAIEIIPGGVNSPVRAFQSVEKEFPLFIKSAKGAYVFDENNNRYVDYIGSWGPMILGHGHPLVIEKIKSTMENGISYGLPSKEEVVFAKLIKECFPPMEMIRLTSSGTESTMSAVRLARAFTKRNKIVKMNGCYHGHSDSLLVSAGSGLLTSAIQDSNGITYDNLKDTIICEYGDVEGLFLAIKNRDVACVILEPIPANMGLVLPQNSYLEKVREICDETDTLLIFDEVISGFRVALGGATEVYGVTPDLITLGKIIGGGFPIGAFGGRRDIMSLLAPIGNVYHAGTLSGNQVSVAAGLTTVNYLKENRVALYKALDEKTEYMVENIKKLAEKHCVNVVVNSITSLFTIYFTDEEKVVDLGGSSRSSHDKYVKYFSVMLKEGVIVPPARFEAHFISLAHEKADLDFTLNAIEKAFIEISKM